MNIISGKFGGRKLNIPKLTGTRPATLLVRGAIFNILDKLVKKTTVLDLYAGSGALGYEALSRGAKSATFIDVADKAIDSIRENAKNLKVEDKVTVIKKDAVRFLKATKDQFDIVFLDPPYANFNEDLVGYTQNVIKAGGFLVISCSSKQLLSDTIGSLSKQLERVYGDTKIAYFQKITAK